MTLDNRLAILRETAGTLETSPEVLRETATKEEGASMEPDHDREISSQGRHGGRDVDMQEEAILGKGGEGYGQWTVDSSTDVQVHSCTAGQLDWVEETLFPLCQEVSWTPPGQ